MAHALNNPLTAVLGFAELIVATSGEGRVKEDAGIIVREAQRMRESVETLLEFWRPAAHTLEPVDVTELVRELARAGAEKLENRGVRLVVQAGDGVTLVRGSKDRLRQMMEHLLNNAAQALAGVGTGKAEGEQVIRVSVSVSGYADGERVYLVVSDTGPGFAQPGRVFEPCDSMGLGLSLCYGIVREHGGEISAFNLHPHGAAVAVELPMVDCSIKKSERGSGRGSIAQVLEDR
jgi:signal transduction histidine kinase